MFLFKFLNLLLPIVNVLYFYFINLYRDKFWLLTIIFVVINILLFLFTLLFLKPNNKVLSNLILYFIFLISSIFFFIFVKNNFVLYTIYFVNFTITLFLFMKIRHEMIYKKENYFLNDVDFYSFLLSSFFMTSAVLALKTFLDINSLFLTALMFLFFLILYFCIYYYHAKNFSDVYKYIFVSALVSSEIFITLLYFPFSFYVGAIMILIFNFIIAVISKDHLLNKININKIKKMLFILIPLVIIILLIAKKV